MDKELKTSWATENALKNCRDEVALTFPKNPSTAFGDPKSAARDLIDDFFTLQARIKKVLDMKPDKYSKGDKGDFHTTVTMGGRNEMLKEIKAKLRGG